MTVDYSTGFVLLTYIWLACIAALVVGAALYNKVFLLMLPVPPVPVWVDRCAEDDVHCEGFHGTCIDCGKPFTIGPAEPRACPPIPVRSRN